MHKEIFTKEQQALLPLVKTFNKNFHLVGGTAIALHIGHRHSIDFDLFSYEPFKNTSIRRKIKSFSKKHEIQIIINHTGELTFLYAEVKFTFYRYHFDLEYTQNFENIIKMPDLITLAAMKAHALAGRAKWKDYVDLYFIMTRFYNFLDIANKATELFGSEFNEKLFRTQLGFFDDVNYVEKVEYLPGFEVPDELIKEKLLEFSLQ